MNIIVLTSPTGTVHTIHPEELLDYWFNDPQIFSEEASDELSDEYGTSLLFSDFSLPPAVLPLDERFDTVDAQKWKVRKMAWNEYDQGKNVLHPGDYPPKPVKTHK